MLGPTPRTPTHAIFPIQCRGRELEKGGVSSTHPAPGWQPAAGSPFRKIDILARPEKTRGVRHRPLASTLLANNL